MRSVVSKVLLWWVVGLGACLSLVPIATAEPAGGGGQTPSALPPADSPVLFRTIELRYPTQGNVPSVDGQTYLYYMESDDYISLPSQGRWTPYDETVQQVLLADFERLWNTNFLTDLRIEIVDDPYPNGVEAKRAIFLMEERERVRIVDFVGSDEFDRTEIDEAMVDNGIELRLDTRIGPGVIRRTEGLLRAMFAEKGFQFAEVSHEVTPLAGGPKVVQLTFTIEEGPKVQIEDISFAGNENMSEGELKKQMKNTRERWFFSFIGGRGTYRPFGFDQDADALVAHYRDNGYIDVQIGQPELDYGDVAEDGKSRPVRLRIPVSEGERYRIGTLEFEGADIIRDEALDQIFEDVNPGDYYSEGAVREAFDVARDAYGGIGYYEMTAFPDLVTRDEENAGDLPIRIEGSPVVDVTLQFQEGEQYFVNRISFLGNRSTHDEVIRREIGLVERGVFNTEALKFAVRRINQLGYFEPLDEDTAIQIDKVPGAENEVDLTLNVEEANMNQLTFGAGASQFDGFFLQLSFQTTNFMGRGESLTVSLQNGERMKNYTLGFTEPYLFGRPITGGFSVFRSDIRFINQFRQSSIGATTTLGFRTGQWSQAFLAYSYQAQSVTEVSQYFYSAQMQDYLRFNPYLRDMLMLTVTDQGVEPDLSGPRTTSKITPSFVFNTVDHPIFPTNGSRYTASFDFATFGGNTKFYKPSAEGVWYFRQSERFIFGLRTRAEYVQPMGDRSNSFPIFERLAMGGDFSLRGFDIRTIGPKAAFDFGLDGDISPFGVVVGGNKSLLINAEYMFSIAQPVRLVFFYDAGQVADFGDPFSMDLFRTSTGIEMRFFMPVLNVPFRLIYAWNPQREGVLNDRFRPQEARVFKFAVGTTF